MPTHFCMSGPHGRCPICHPCNGPCCNTSREYTVTTNSAVKCPVCSGNGKLMSYGYTDPWVQCHGCGGKGWVVV